MSREIQLLSLLNDTCFHSGEDLAASLGVSRAAVWKLVRHLQDWQLDIHAVQGRGYRLTRAVELLNTAVISETLNPAAQARLSDLSVHLALDSTNTYLMNGPRGSMASGTVCLAERQLAGRGRRGRAWVSPFGCNLYMSVLWRFQVAAPALSGLGLAVGTRVAEALVNTGVTDIGLKWPNDLLWQGRKLGGILLEYSGEAGGSGVVVAGIGLNIRMPGQQEVIDQPWVDLETVTGTAVSRNQLATRVLDQLLPTLDAFEREGFSPIAEQFARFDLVRDQAVTLQLPHTTVVGIARGVDDSGALLLETAVGIQLYTAGEISLRITP